MYIPYCLQLFGGYMIKLAVMWISVYVTEIPRAIITPWNCCSVRFRPDNKSWCFCASFNHPLLFTLFLKKPLITTPGTVGTRWQQRNAELVVLFCFINLCPWSLLHPCPVRLVKSCCFYEFLVGVVNTELNTLLNYTLNKMILEKVCWVSDGCTGRKARERNLSSKGGRRDSTWSTSCSCHLSSFGRVGKDRLAPSCPLSCAALQAALQGKVSVGGLCTPAHNSHLGHLCTNISVQGNHSACFSKAGTEALGPSLHLSSKVSPFHFLVIRAELCQFMFSRAVWIQFSWWLSYFVWIGCW